MPTLIAFMKIPHRRTALTDHLDDMRNYMPAEHRALIEEVAAMPDIRSAAVTEPFNAILDAMAAFRRVHYRWAEEYISRWTDDPRGTGGTPYMEWLEQMLVETEALGPTRRHGMVCRMTDAGRQLYAQVMPEARRSVAGEAFRNH